MLGQYQKTVQNFSADFHMRSMCMLIEACATVVKFLAFVEKTEQGYILDQTEISVMV